MVWFFGGITGSLVLSIVRRCFNLSFELADRVVRWIGRSGEHLGERGEEDDLRNRFIGLAGKFSLGNSKPNPGEETDEVGNGGSKDGNEKEGN